MTPDEAYGISGVPVKILSGVVEPALEAIGVPIEPFTAQAIVFVTALVLAVVCWLWFAKTGEWSIGRVGVLVAALAVTLTALPIAVFWVQFWFDPPRGEIDGTLSGEVSDDWHLELRDPRHNSMAVGNIDAAQRAFSIYYRPRLGQVPSSILSQRQGCKDNEQPLDRDQVFGGAQVTLTLSC